MPQINTSSVFDQHRELLAALTSDTTILQALAEAGKKQAWWSPDRAWTRTYASFEPAQPALVTMLFESAGTPQKICRVEICKEKPDVRRESEWRVYDDRLGWLRLTCFPHDAELPTLAAVLNEATRAKVVRYRPYKRCTIRFEAQTEYGCVYVKVFPNERGADLHDESLNLWNAAQAGEFEFEIAPPIKWEPKTRALWQGAVAGAPIIDKLKTPEGADLARQIGRATASLTHSSLKPSQTLDAEAQLQRTQRYAKELGKRISYLKPSIEFFMKKLREIHAQRRRPLRPIHGSPHPHQWLQNGDRLGLVDFDRISLGEPELDVATFIAEMDFEDHAKYPVEKINEAFITGYESRAGALDRDLLRAYRAHKQFSKALKAARAVRPDGDTCAERNLQRALNGITGGVA